MSKTFATQCRLLPAIPGAIEDDNDQLAERMDTTGEGEVSSMTKTTEAPFRKIVVRSKPLSGSAGSASVEMGNTRVLCSVNGPREQQSGDSAVLEGVLNMSLRGAGVDPALRYAIEHALQAVVCLRKLARTEIDIELNVLSDDGGALAACLLASGVALASANIEMFDTLLACNVLLIPSSPTEPPRIIVDPDQALIAEHAGKAAVLTLGVMPSIGQIVCAELSGDCPLSRCQLHRALPAVFEHSLSLYGVVRASLLKMVAEEAL